MTEPWKEGGKGRREVKNLRDDKRALSAKVSDLETKLFKTRFAKNENQGEGHQAREGGSGS